MQANKEYANIPPMPSDNLFIDHSKPSNTDETSLSEQLSQCSAPYDDPLSAVNWSALDMDSFWLPEEAITLYGTEAYNQLSIGQQRRLSQVEFINFIEAGLWLESLFMERIGRSVREERNQLSDLTYHLHELREEAGHSLMFIELIKQSNLKIPIRHFKQLSFANLFARYAPFNGAMFWIAVLAGEQVPDKMNRFIRKNKNCVCSTIVDIVSIHIHDEARHIAHAKSMINSKLSMKFPFSQKVLNHFINKMFNDFVNAYYFPPNEVYYAAGLDEKTNWNKLATTNQHRRDFVDNSIMATIETINASGFQLSYKVS